MAEYLVTGAVAVVPTADGTERYLYRGARITGKGFTEDGLDRLVEVGLIEEVPSFAEIAEAAEAEAEAERVKAAEAEKAKFDQAVAAAAAKIVADRDAAAAKQPPAPAKSAPAKPADK